MTRTLSIVLLSALTACSGENSNTQSATQGNQPGASQLAASQSAASHPAASSSDAPGCDASLWNRVYNPSRLQKVSTCLSVTGIIEESSADDDGDQHFLLKLDPGQDNLLNKRNAQKKGSDIVLEVVCANPTTMKKAKKTCAGYTNPIPIPAVGAHVRVTGTYVIDSHNGWAEIHPVSKFQSI